MVLQNGFFKFKFQRLSYLAFVHEFLSVVLFLFAQSPVLLLLGLESLVVGDFLAGLHADLGLTPVHLFQLSVGYIFWMSGFFLDM